MSPRFTLVFFPLLVALACELAAPALAADAHPAGWLPPIKTVAVKDGIGDSQRQAVHCRWLEFVFAGSNQRIARSSDSMELWQSAERCRASHA